MSVFTFRGDAQRDRARIEIAKNGVKRLKTIRHPNVLLMKETVEIESGNEITIHVVTEATTTKRQNRSLMNLSLRSRSKAGPTGSWSF